MSELALKLIAENIRTKAKTLDLGNCGLEEVPTEVCKCVWLEELNLSTSYYEYDFEKDDWTTVRSKNKYKKNKISKLPNGLSALSNLTKLIINGEWSENKSPLSDINSLKELSNLQQLYCSYTSINSLAPLKKLQRLQILDISETNIYDLIPISLLLNLEYLNCANTSVNRISPLRDLYKLKRVNLYKTKINDISPISSLIELNTFDIGHTDVVDLKPLRNLVNLKDLTIIDSKTNDWEIINQLQSLEKLNVSATNLQSLGEISGLKQLKTLWFAYPKLTNISEIIAFRNLEVISLTSAKLSDIEPMQFLEKLRNITLKETQVADLRPLLNKKLLEFLDISETLVSDLYPLSELTQLIQIICNESKVENLSPLSNKKALEFLDIRKTFVSDLRPLSELKQLLRVYCNGSKVEDLTPLLGLIKNNTPVKTLEGFDWSIDNNFETLPVILVKDCPLITPPIEIVNQGNDAIIQYFNELERAKQTNSLIRLSEAKCLILGEGGAGKTSLTRKLLNHENQLPEEKETTQGINVYPLDWELPDGTDFRLNIWDFGGQEIYHATHQFFLTKRSLYILLDDTRKDEKTVNDPSFNYWLQVAELYGGGSPLLIVQNEKGDRSKELDLRGMQGRFGFVKDAKATNLLTCRGLDKVWEAIQFWLKQLPHIGEEQPKAWLDIRRELERLTLQEKRDYISLDEYYSICAQYTIPERGRALFLSGYLHDFGAFLHFQDHPLLRKTLVLNNQWATDAVYKVLDYEPVKRSFGHFTREDLASIWADKRYAEQHEELLALMEKFELCYKLHDEKMETWLAPQLLSVLQPDALIWDQTNNLQIRYEYEFMPKGLLSQHIVRMHRYVLQPELAWKSGVVFDRANSQALVTEAWGSRFIRLRARGIQAKELLTLLSEDFDTMHKRLEGLKVKKLIPCNCKICRNLTEPHFYDYDDLALRKETGKRTVECKLPPYEDVSVVGLLDGVFAKVINDELENSNSNTQITNNQPFVIMENQTNKSVQRPLRLYISYSNKDVHYRDKLLNHLKGLVNKGQIEIWSDHLLQAGEEFMKTFQHELSKMDIWVVLISPDSLNSNFIWENEYTVAQERQVPIIPILLRPAMWEGSPIEKLFILPSFAKAVTKWEDEDEAFLDIVNGISKMVATKMEATRIQIPEEPLPVVPLDIPSGGENSSTDKVKKRKPTAIQTYKIFLASSSELIEDRDQFEIFINRENKDLIKKGVFLELVRWEDFLDAMSNTRLQDEYNKVLCECDIAVCLFFTKVGKYTAEEFNKAFGQFKKSGKPKIYTYFKDAPVKPSAMREFQTVMEFKDKLDKLGHFPNHYESLGDLKHHFGEQLKKLGFV